MVSEFSVCHITQLFHGFNTPTNKPITTFLSPPIFSLPLYSYTAIQLHSYTATQLHSYTATQLHSYTDRGHYRRLGILAIAHVLLLLNPYDDYRHVVD
jgi:hypothetical protein